MDNVFIRSYQALCENDVECKLTLTHQLAEDWAAGLLQVDAAVAGQVETIEIPGRPAQPELVPPKALKKRKLTTLLGQQAMVHAIAHIEFNAINLALDAVYRFRDMPDAFLSDWIQVAKEEAYHFSLVQQRLQDLGAHYGDFPAHNGLWALAVETDHDILARMAMVPRVMEARGIDVNPGISKKFEAIGDQQMVEVLAIIFRDEIGHVAVGSRWFQMACQRQELDSEETYFEMIRQSGMAGKVRGPFLREARLQAGFSERELARLVAGS